MSILLRVAKAYSSRARAYRAVLFRTLFSIDSNTRILDLGSETGAAIHAVLLGTDASPANVYIADIDAAQVREGALRFGYQPVVINESTQLPFTDDFFDIVYCSSVIEHVTVRKDEVWAIKSGREFRQRARERQRIFAEEIRRLGRQYFVQTPYRHFPLESHSWLPFVAWLPRRLQIPLFRFAGKIWIKRTTPDWYLLNRKELGMLFPGADIRTERSLGMTKSLMAIRRD